MAGTEVVGGFTFKRKNPKVKEQPATKARKAASSIDDNIENAPPNKQNRAAPAKTKSKQREVEDNSPPAFVPSDVGGLKFYELLPGNVPDSHRFLQLCKFVCDAEQKHISRLYEGEHQHVADAAAVMIRSFLAKVEGAIRNGAIQPGTSVAELNKPKPIANPALDKKKADLRARVAELEKEQAEWNDVRAKFDDFQMAEQPLAEDDAEAKEYEEFEVPSLTKLYKESAVKLIMEADGLAALVAGAQDACARAEELNASLATTFHRESFRVFPHVDSPQTLIRQLAAQTPAR